MIWIPSSVLIGLLTSPCFNVGIKDLNLSAGFEYDSSIITKLVDYVNEHYLNIKEIAISCVEDQNALVLSHHQKIETYFDDELPLVFCDGFRIRQILMNLLNNAIKFSPEFGKIEISISKEELNDGTDGVKISVVDEGPGILEDEKESLFLNFVQSKNKVHHTKGTGLGLAIARELTHAHQGGIWCDNNDSGGAVFNVLIPVNKNC